MLSLSPTVGRPSVRALLSATATDRGDGTLTKGMHLGNVANKGDGIPPHSPSNRLLSVV